MRQVRDAKDNMQSEEIEELLGVAKQAGLQVKQKLNKFEPGLLADEEDDIDVSV
jgi:hypothetical protein